eukprot:12694454-Alexandrium_andersonii.AAC.1
MRHSADWPEPCASKSGSAPRPPTQRRLARANPAAEAANATAAGPEAWAASSDGAPPACNT